MRTGVILAIETSGRAASIALHCPADGGGGDDDPHIREIRLDATGVRHARTLVPQLKSLVEGAGLSPCDCGVIAVSVGPGSFTGLRVGVACAKTFAWATGADVVAVPTPAVLAAGAFAAYSFDAVTVVANAERGQLFATKAQRDGPGVRLDPVRIVDADPFLQSHDPAQPLIGPVPAKIRNMHPEAGWLTDSEACDIHTPQAAFVARLAAAMLAAGHPPVDPYKLLPDYGRLSAAEEKRLKDDKQAGEERPPIAD